MSRGGAAPSIALTAEGAAVLHALRRRTTDALARRIDDLTGDRRAALVAALPVLEQIALPDQSFHLWQIAAGPAGVTPAAAARP